MPDLMALVGSCQIAIAAFIGKKPSFLLKRSVPGLAYRMNFLCPAASLTRRRMISSPSPRPWWSGCTATSAMYAESRPSASARPAPTRSPAVSTKHANLLLANPVMSASGGLSQSGASRYSFESSDQATAPIS